MQCGPGKKRRDLCLSDGTMRLLQRLRRRTGLTYDTLVYTALRRLEIECGGSPDCLYDAVAAVLREDARELRERLEGR